MENVENGKLNENYKVKWTEQPLAANSTYRQNGEHHLGHIKSMPPIVISNISVIFFDA